MSDSDPSTHKPSLAFTTILLLSFLAALTPFSMDMYLPSLPTIAADLGVSTDSAQHTVSAFLIGIAAGQLVHGPLSDTVGRIRVLVVALSIFVVATLLCAIATSLELLVTLRFVQALGCGALPVLVPAIVRDLTEGRDTAKTMSKMLMVMTAAPLLAPIAGGYLLVWINWRAVFYALLALGCCSWLIVVFYLTESHKSVQAVARDQLQRALRGYFEVLRHRVALGYVLCVSFVFASMFTYLTSAAFVYVEYFRVAPQNSGYLFAVNMIFLLVGNLTNARLLRRHSPERLLIAGVLMSALSGLSLAATAYTHWGGLWGIAINICILLACMGMIAPNAAAVILNYFPTLAGTASSVINISRFAFGGLGGYVVSVLHNGTPVPMALTICAANILALGSCYWLVLRAKAHQ